MGVKIYEYTITFEGGFEGVVIDATDAGHAYSELMDDNSLWPEEATIETRIISIIRGVERPYEA